MTVRLLIQVLLLFFLTIAFSGIGALVQANFFSEIFSMNAFIENIVIGLIFIILVYVNFWYCFSDQVAELRGRIVGSERYPVWVKQYILFNCALFVEEVFYYVIKDVVSLSEITYRLLGFGVFAFVYAYMMSGREFKSRG